MEKKDCIICGTENPLFIVNKDGFDFFKCQKCGLIYLFPRLNLGDLVKKCYSGLEPTQSLFGGNFFKVGKEIKFRIILKKIKTAKLVGPLLDVGCSRGEFLMVARGMGFSASGVEVNREKVLVARKRGLDIFEGSLEMAKLESDYFSVIHLGDVLEHVVDPVVFLEECKRILKKGGVIVISTPNSDCLWAKGTFFLNQVIGFPWPILTPPHHLFVFSEYNLRSLMERIGFNVTGVYYWNNSLRYQLAVSGLLKKWEVEKSLLSLIYILLVSFTFIAFHFFIFLISPFLKRRLSMTIFANK